MKFEICKKEKVLISNLEKVKKIKVYFFGFHNKLANENFTEVHYCLVKKRSVDGQAAVKYKMKFLVM